MNVLLAVLLLYHISTVYADFIPRMGDVGQAKEHNREEVWGYAEVREGAHLFWWLYYTSHPDGYQNRPWIIWLQGGPGLSGTALGNFLEIGALDNDLNPRNASWVNEASVMFVDNPVGVGFSYDENDTRAHVDKPLEAISVDMVAFLQVFLEEYPHFRSMPLFLFGQSYGGKYVTHLGYTLQKLKQSGGIDINLRGIGIGNGFVSPTDFAIHYGEFLYQTGVIDDRTLDENTDVMKQYLELMQEGKWANASDKFDDGLGILFSNAAGMNFYNILEAYPKPEDRERRNSQGTMWLHDHPMFGIYRIDMKPLMNGAIRDKLRIIPEEKKWDEGLCLYCNQGDDFLKDTIYAVDWLLQNSDVQVNVYEGQLDVACHTPGAVAWVNRLTWSGLEDFRHAERRALLDPVTGAVETFVKSHKTLKFYWNLNSGHTVPTDVPYAALRMLQRILDNEDH